MNSIDHIFEPSRLFLVWHHSDIDKARPRRIIGELFKEQNQIKFQYLKSHPDYNEALLEGFIGFPAFTRTTDQAFDDALEVFTKRLPPRKRADFGKYLLQYGLPEDFQGSDLALLAYTGARLASDNFELCPDFRDANAPFDFIMEISGANYHTPPSELPEAGDTITLSPEPNNPHDSSAIAVFCKNKKIGYINKAANKSLLELITKSTLSGSIRSAKIKQDKIQILILLHYR